MFLDHLAVYDFLLFVNCCSIFCSSCTDFHPHKGSITLQSCQHWWLIYFHSDVLTCGTRCLVSLGVAFCAFLSDLCLLLGEMAIPVLAGFENCIAYCRILGCLLISCTTWGYFTSLHGLLRHSVRSVLLMNTFTFW